MSTTAVRPVKLPQPDVSFAFPARVMGDPFRVGQVPEGANPKTFAGSLAVHLVVLGFLMIQGARTKVEIIPTRPDQKYETLSDLVQWRDIKVGDNAGAKAGHVGAKGGSSFTDRDNTIKVFRTDTLSQAVIVAPTNTSQKLLKDLANILTVRQDSTVITTPKSIIVAHALAQPKDVMLQQKQNDLSGVLDMRDAVKVTTLSTIQVPHSAPQPSDVIAPKLTAINHNPALPLINASSADVRLEKPAAPAEPSATEKAMSKLSQFRGQHSVDTVQSASARDLLVMLPNPTEQVQVGQSKLGSLAIEKAAVNGEGKGGKGSGTGIADGNATGKGEAGVGTGMTTIFVAGMGDGADKGIANGVGAGGAGNNPATKLHAGGVFMTGGAAYVPSFGDSAPMVPDAKNASGDHSPEVIVVSTSSSSDSLGRYRYLRGQVFTTYVTLLSGYLVIEFEDPRPAGDPADLAAPEPTSADMTGAPKDMKWIIGGTLNAQGKVESIKTLMSINATAADIQKLLAKWKFRPALSGGKPVRTQIMLGFNVKPN